MDAGDDPVRRRVDAEQFVVARLADPEGARAERELTDERTAGSGNRDLRNDSSHRVAPVGRAPDGGDHGDE